MAKDDDKSGADKTGGQAGDKDKDKNKDKDTKNMVQMSQEDFDATVKDRVGRAQQTALEKQAKALGFESVKVMEDAIKATKKKEDDEKSELQKLKEKVAEDERGKIDAETEISETLIKSAFLVEAAKAGIEDPEAAYFVAQGKGLIDAEADVETKTVKGMDKTVKKFVEKHPSLVKKAGPTKTDSQGGPTNPPAEKGEGGKDATGQMLDFIKTGKIAKE